MGEMVLQGATKILKGKKAHKQIIDNSKKKNEDSKKLLHKGTSISDGV